MSQFGQGVLAARRLVDAGVRFATVSLGGWDTHSQTFNAHKTRLAPTLDTVLSALIKDLDDLINALRLAGEKERLSA